MPWAFNSYSTIMAEPLIEAEEEVFKRRLAVGCPGRSRSDGCAYCGGPPCGLWNEIYEAHSAVAWVPPDYGDTATGRHAHDAIFIEQAPADIDALIAEIERLRAERR